MENLRLQGTEKEKAHVLCLPTRTVAFVSVLEHSMDIQHLFWSLVGNDEGTFIAIEMKSRNDFVCVSLLAVGIRHQT